MRIDIMESNFSGWMQEEDLKFIKPYTESGMDLYRNTRNRIVYPHDFPPGVPLHKSYPAVKAKYDRRVKRFQRLMSSGSNILAVYMDSPANPYTDIDTCRLAHKRLQTIYPHTKIDFLMLTLETGRSFESRTIENMGNGFIHISFDFKDYRPGKPKHAVDLKQCAAAMQCVASVKDYRTAAEKKAMIERTRKVKLREYGAENRWQYFLIRRKKELQRIKDFLFHRKDIAEKTV